MFRPRARYRDAVITARYRDTVNASGAGENGAARTASTGGQTGQNSMNTSEAGENSTAHTASTGGQTGQNNRILIRKRFLALTPGEMCKITIPAEKLKNAPEIIFDIEGTQV